LTAEQQHHPYHLASADTDDFAVTKNFIASDSGFTFVTKAGEELKFGEYGKSG
jgi:hypothetical protein